MSHFISTHHKQQFTIKIYDQTVSREVTIILTIFTKTTQTKKKKTLLTSGHMNLYVMSWKYKTVKGSGTAYPSASVRRGKEGAGLCAYRAFVC